MDPNNVVGRAVAACAVVLVAGALACGCTKKEDEDGDTFVVGFGSTVVALLDPAAVSVTEGGASATITATISSAAPAGGTTIFLGNSDPSAVTAPSLVTVPEGQTSTTFQIAAAPDADTAAEVVTLSALNASPVVSVTVTTVDTGPNAAPVPSLAPATLAVTENAAAGSETVSLTVAAPTGGTTVVLVNPDPSAVTVPATVDVLAGASSAVFAVQAINDDDAVSEAVVIRATVAGNTATATVNVTDADRSFAGPPVAPVAVGSTVSVVANGGADGGFGTADDALAVLQGIPGTVVQVNRTVGFVDVNQPFVGSSGGEVGGIALRGPDNVLETADDVVAILTSATTTAVITSFSIPFAFPGNVGVAVLATPQGGVAVGALGEFGRVYAGRRSPPTETVFDVGSGTPMIFDPLIGPIVQVGADAFVAAQANAPGFAFQDADDAVAIITTASTAPAAEFLALPNQTGLPPTPVGTTSAVIQLTPGGPGGGNDQLGLVTGVGLGPAVVSTVGIGDGNGDGISPIALGESRAIVLSGAANGTLGQNDDNIVIVSGIGGAAVVRSALAPRLVAAALGVQTVATVGTDTVIAQAFGGDFLAATQDDAVHVVRVDATGTVIAVTTLVAAFQEDGADRTTLAAVGDRSAAILLRGADGQAGARDDVLAIVLDVAAPALTSVTVENSRVVSGQSVSPLGTDTVLVASAGPDAAPQTADDEILIVSDIRSGGTPVVSRATVAGLFALQTRLSANRVVYISAGADLTGDTNDDAVITFTAGNPPAAATRTPGFWDSFNVPVPAGDTAVLRLANGRDDIPSPLAGQPTVPTADDHLRVQQVP